MNENVSTGSHATPMLFPYEPEQFWQSIRLIIREEVTQAEKQRPESPRLANSRTNLQTPLQNSRGLRPC